MKQKAFPDKREIEKPELEISFIPILCSAPLIYAHCHGFFQRNGLTVDLRPAPGWSGIKELMVHGLVDAVHMLAPMPLACSLGIDGKRADIRLATVQNVNGQALTLAKKHLGISDVRDMKGFTFGVPYRFSMHYYLLCYFLAENGVNPLKDVVIEEVAPSRMPYYLENGRVDGVFAPEPFNQIPVHRDIGFIYILSKDIWPGHPCCSLATSRGFVDKYPATYRAMLRSVLEAELVLHEADPQQRKVIAREICGPQYLNVENPVAVEEALAGDFPDGKGARHNVPDRIDFLPYPWPEYGSWMLSQMQRWAQLPGRVRYKQVVESVFQDDTWEIAEALGFRRQDQPRLAEVSYTGKDPYCYMRGQPFCTFQKKPKPLRSYNLSKPLRRRLSEIIGHLAEVAGGKTATNIEITAADEISFLEQALNETILNQKFTREALAEQRDNLTRANQQLEQEAAERSRVEDTLRKRSHELGERVRELDCLYSISKILTTYDHSFEEMLGEAVAAIPTAWQYPEIACARIVLEGEQFATGNFEESRWKQSAPIRVYGQPTGTVEVCYSEESPESDEGPFRKEERALINALSERLERVLERRKAEEALWESQERYRALVDNTVLGIAVMDTDHRILMVNSTFSKLFNKSADDFVAKYCFREFEKRDAVCPHCPGVRAMASGKTEEVETQGVRDDGSRFCVHNRAAPFFGPDGVLRGFIEMVEEIDARKKAEEELREAKAAAEAATQAKSCFLANMSHEIRTPMTAILGFTDILLNDLQQPEAIEAAQIVKRNGEHLLQIINDILDISKIEAGSVEMEMIRWSPRQVVAEVVSLLHVRADAKGLTLADEYPGPLPETITTEPTRLRQILVNLVGNAIKFTETGGVRIVTRLVEAPGAEPKLRFDVIDTGVGIPDDQIENVFEPFTQADGSNSRRYEGTGLGLAISLRFASMLGGEITAKSEPGKGSTFTLTIATGPLDGIRLVEYLTGAPPASEEPVESTREFRGKLRCRVLLAEDIPDNQRLISAVLRESGAVVTIAQNGREAVYMALAARPGRGRRYSDPSEPFDVILMDMQMPVLNGYEATRQLRYAGYTDPIIALTAHAMQGDRQKCLDAGCDDYLTKPADRKKLLETVAKWASRKREQAATAVETDRGGEETKGMKEQASCSPGDQADGKRTSQADSPEGDER